MKPIEAGQHIYANVEAEQSPQKLGGFQTLFHTQGFLTEAEVEELESHLVYFQPEVNPVKRLFFRLSGGKVVVGQIVSLAGADRLGRTGRYLAHSLVFSAEDFTSAGLDPFQVFACFQFIATVEEAWRLSEGLSGNIGLARLELGQQQEAWDLKAAKPWPRAELKKLVSIALRAPELAQERKMVAFVGSPRSIEEALAAAFIGLPTSLRPACSFDTHFAGCNPVRLYYWAAGFFNRPVGGEFLVVEVEGKKVEVQEQRPETPYERWLEAMLEAWKLDFVVRHRDSAHRLCSWLQGHGEMPKTDDIETEVVESVFLANPTELRGRVRERLNKQVSPVLADLVVEAICMRGKPAEILSGLRNGFDLGEVVSVLWSRYEKEKFRVPERSELQALAKLLEKKPNSRLELVWLCWAGERELFRGRLVRAEEGEYRWFVELALGHRLVKDPLVLLVRGKGRAFLDVLIGSRWEIGLKNLIEALLAEGEEGVLDGLVPFISKRPFGELKKTLGLVKGRCSSDSSKAFLEALEKELRQRQPAEATGIMGSLRKKLSNSRLFGGLLGDR